MSNDLYLREVRANVEDISQLAVWIKAQRDQGCDVEPQTGDFLVDARESLALAAADLLGLSFDDIATALVHLRHQAHGTGYCNPDATFEPEDDKAAGNEYQIGAETMRQITTTISAT